MKEIEKKIQEIIDESGNGELIIKIQDSRVVFIEKRVKIKTTK